MDAIRENTRAIEVITGHNNEGPCKFWGYVRFETLEHREGAIPYLKSLVERRVLGVPIIESDRGVLDECWRCGALDSEEKAQGRNRIAVAIQHVHSTQNAEVRLHNCASQLNPDKTTIPKIRSLMRLQFC